MSKLKIKNGTPVTGPNLCGSCTWGQVMTGYRESDSLSICTNTNPNMVVPFAILECTRFDDKHRPDWRQMEKLAIEIQPVRVSAKTNGFSIAPAVRAPGNTDPDNDE